jgi:hypothetical protein
MLENHSIPRTDPFTTTGSGTPWIDHEWLFQITAAVTEAAAGPAGLVALRALLVAALAALMVGLGLQSGLSPPGALVLAVLCLFGARIRFFLRPELVTLLIAPVVVWLFLNRTQRRSYRWLAGIAALMAVGANFHGGLLVVPPLLAGLLAAEWFQWLATRRGPSPLWSGVAGVAVASVAPIANPNGWRLYEVPLNIAHLVGLPHIPNPEWLSPSFGDYPPLFVAMAVGLAVLAVAERRATRWILLVMISALALRYVRNVGLFFVLFPITISAALAKVPLLAAGSPTSMRLLGRTAAVGVSFVIVASMMLVPGRSPGFELSRNYYPFRAWDFLEREDLHTAPAYNDVRFGGFLIHRHYPHRRTFLDDRNEIHEPLLARIHEILKSSNPQAWQELMDEHAIELAIIRYHAPFTVLRPDGETVGRRGFSALWFPRERWALIYWDDVSMVLADRQRVDPSLVNRHEYRVIRPDDTDELERRLASDPELLPRFVAELERKIREQPDCQRALELSRLLIQSVS